MRKSMIMRGKKSIDLLFSSGKTISSGVIMFKYLDSEDTKFLFAVSSNKFKRAVDRNRIKRLMKESFKGVDVKGKSIAVVYIGKTNDPKFEIVKSSINDLIKKI